jgi:hemoglobin
MASCKPASSCHFEKYASERRTVKNPLQLFDITPDQIDQIVAMFYMGIRQHDVLGPIFAAHIADDAWPEHEVKIAAFWRNAILKERSYSGNPMRVHMQTSDVQPAHFADWLALFDEVLAAQLPEDTARSFSALAHRIGHGLRLGLEQVRQPKDAPPVFT